MRFFGLLAPLGVLIAQDSAVRTWTDVNGRQVEGELIAYDNVRFTIRGAEGKKGVIPANQLSVEDREYLKKWRSENPDAPWIDTGKLGAWPLTVGAGVVEAKKGEPPAEGWLMYESEHFEMFSDRELPLVVVGEMASIFEATRMAVRTLPLGLGAQPPRRPSPMRRFNYAVPGLKHDPDRLRVQMFGTPEAYSKSGGPVGTSGSYITWMNRTLISLENVGKKTDDGELILDEIQNEFVLRHEITHQIMHPWLTSLPMWLKEGFAEYLAAAGYAKGRYSFSGMDQRMATYVNKWRFDEDHKRIPALHPSALMAMSEQQWQSALSVEIPIRNYNSAALLTYYFLHQDGEQIGKPLAAYFDAIRRGVPPRQAEREHLLRGRTHEQIAEAMNGAWQAQGVTLIFES